MLQAILKNLSFLKMKKKQKKIKKWLNPIIMYDIRAQDRHALALSNSTNCSKIYLYLLFQKSRKPYTYRCSKTQNFMFSFFFEPQEKVLLE